MKRIALVLCLAFPLSAALEQDPSSDLAAYELALTYSAKGDHAECIALLEPRVKAKKNEYRSAMYAILGNCYDNGGDPERAIATYRRGLKVDRNDTQLLYNLAVTLAGRGELDEARKLLKQQLALLGAIAEGPNKGRDHTAKQVIPFFRELYDRELLDPYAGVALLSLKLPGTEEWVKANEAEFEAYLAFMREQR